MTEDPLAEEEKFYQEQKGDLLRTSEGKFVLIKSRRLIGTFDTPEKAYSEGIEKLGNVPMLIVQVRRDPPPNQVPALTLGILRASLQH
jgi:hypothetical protein